MILSLFSGCGALDFGFEEAGFETSLAYDIRPFSVDSWNRNRKHQRLPVAHVADITKITLDRLDSDYGRTFRPSAVIGGPPCQSFSRANSSKIANDPREKLVGRFFTVALKLHDRSPLDFIMMENVQELANDQYNHILKHQINRLKRHGFNVRYEILDAVKYGVPQFRKRLILVAYNKIKFPSISWAIPSEATKIKDVGETIKGLVEPIVFSRDLTPDDIPFHPNHWYMTPRSQKFFNGSLRPGTKYGRSFKTLSWNKPSYTVSFGNREVHVHPSGKRRLSIYEAMQIQGFPDKFILYGNLSQQVTQVSEAVPPPLALAIATGIKKQLKYRFKKRRQEISRSAIAEAV